MKGEKRWEREIKYKSVAMETVERGICREYPREKMNSIGRGVELERRGMRINKRGIPRVPFRLFPPIGAADSGDSTGVEEEKLFRI
ncbi:hypothetical protein TNCT_686271 [Trichonephila clavata]|uniref:Uncharacterized protein n=1 Tax=Trichonephila clavata TaxID=2740835 RepID=A0A8X6JYF6_TRICU|nr:hypothetical protein TNCT_686271 [Trichonephila clavata]